jgi:hypothetical protein
MEEKLVAPSKSKVIGVENAGAADSRPAARTEINLKFTFYTPYLETVLT